MTKRSVPTPKRARVYREAAKLIEDWKQRFSCSAVLFADTGEYSHMTPVCMANKAAAEYHDTFHDPAERGDLQSDLFSVDADRERRNVRVLMLCFMAAMVEAGDA